MRYTLLISALFTPLCLASPLSTASVFAHKGATNDILKTITFTRTGAIPSTDDNNLYIKLAAVSFYSGTTGGACSGTERTLDLSGNEYWNSRLNLNGSAGEMGSVNFHTDVIEHAATALGYTLSNNECVKFKLDYKNGDGSAAGPLTINSNTSNYELGGLTIAGGEVTLATPENATQSFPLESNNLFQDGSGNTLDRVTLTRSTSRTITVKNVGYNSTATLTASILPSSLSDQFTNNCNGQTLASGATCTITYNGTTDTGDGYISITDTNNSENTKILPFNIQTTGEALCWGSNQSGQLGDGTNNPKSLPTAVSGPLSNVLETSLGSSHSCALLSTGEARCWGHGNVGQLGNNSDSDSASPVVVGPTGTPLSSITQISSGLNHTCALLSDSTVRCWGDNLNGQLGNDDPGVNRNIPVTVGESDAPLSGVVEISSGNAHTCALLNTGGVKCWGDNFNGQIGNGTSGMGVQSDTPSQVSGLTSGVVAISSGGYHTCALLKTGAVKCWGDNYYGQLGDNTGGQGASEFSNTPVSVRNSSNTGAISNVVALTGNESSSCALLDTGAVQCWGDEFSGQLGNNVDANSIKKIPVSVLDTTGITAISGVVAISAKGGHVCALMGTGAAQCWGKNSSGQLGNNLSANSPLPVEVLDESGTAHISSLSGISAGGGHTCATIRRS